MKLLNKYLITFLASGLIVFPTFADVTKDASATSIDELPAIDFGSTYNDTEPIDGGGSADSPGFGDDVGDVPLDDGIFILLGAGLAYGAARLRKKKEDTDLFI